MPTVNDEANQPLIASSEELEGTDLSAGDIAAPHDQTSTGTATLGWFIWALCLTAGFSGLLFGYDTGVISSTLVSVGDDLSSRNLTILDKSLITSATALFALIFSAPSGFLADAIGRKNVVIVADVLFVAGALCQAFSDTVWLMIVGRSVIGAAVGTASFVAPLYISELAPAAWRGRLVTVSALFITAGQVVAYIVGWLLSSSPHGWRWMVGLGGGPAVVQLCLLLFMPDTPRWLAKVGRLQGARDVLQRIHPDEGASGVVEAILDDIAKEVRREAQLSYQDERPSAAKADLSSRLRNLITSSYPLWTIPRNRRALAIGCVLQASQQLCGFNSLMYFSATIFAMVGFQSPTLTSLCIAVTNLTFTIVAFHYIDRIGRRRILLVSVPVMVIGLAMCSIAFIFVDFPLEAKNVMNISSETSSTKPWAVVLLLAMVIYVAAYAVGLGNVPWQQSELFPLSVRSLGSSVATATNWGSNFIVGLTFLPMMKLASPSMTFLVYGLICTLSWWVIFRIYPETAGLSLEEVDELLSESFGVEKSLNRFQGRGPPTMSLEDTQI